MPPERQSRAARIAVKPTAGKESTGDGTRSTATRKPPHQPRTLPAALENKARCQPEGKGRLIARTLRITLSVALLASPVLAQAQQPRISYRLQYATPGNNQVEITLELGPAISAPATFVIPRNYPGGYGLVPYDSFVENPRARSPDGRALAMRKDGNGPRWEIGQAGESIFRIEYQVDIARMEQDIHSAIDSSKIRPGYVGILGYSVFGYVDGFEEGRVELRIDAPSDWPVLSTLSPAIPKSGSTTVRANSYYALADSEVLMGPAMQVRSLPGKIGLIMAVYAEGNVDSSLEGKLAREALDDVQAYFGTIPFDQYTVQLELLQPLPGHDYGFSQEHIDSGTFSSSRDHALSQDSPERVRLGTLFNFAHHMAHCWIPKRAYGIGYMPFTWEVPPVIDTIWFNEGFGRYAAIVAVANARPGAEGSAVRERQLAGLRRIVEQAPRFIRQMSLLVLSREASFMYEKDFRVGQNTFARGALMAAEMDDQIRKQTAGKKSLRDGLRYLVERTSRSPQPFKTDDVPGFIRTATGVDVKDIFDRWMEPNPQVK